MKWSDLVGKTIKSVDDGSGVNVVIIQFTDGTDCVIDTEHVGHNIHGPTINDSKGYKES
jgi:hypothetical protein